MHLPPDDNLLHNNMSCHHITHNMTRTPLRGPPPRHGASIRYGDYIAGNEHSGRAERPPTGWNRPLQTFASFVPELGSPDSGTFFSLPIFRLCIEKQKRYSPKTLRPKDFLDFEGRRRLRSALTVRKNFDKIIYDYPFSSAREKAGERGIGSDKLRP